MWQKLDRSRRVSRIVWAQWRPRRGSAEPLEHCGRESRAAACRKRGGARDGQDLVTEKQGGRWRRSPGKQVENQESGVRLGLTESPPHGLTSPLRGLGPSGKSFFLPSLGLGFSI